MNRFEIENELKKHDNTLLGGGFKDRGPWGDSKWRGNSSGWITAYLLYKYKVNMLAELFAGSGTSSDVCRDYGNLPYFGMDLNPNPVRKNIISYNAVTDEVPEQVLGADMLFAHPPYSSLINIPYCDKEWKDTTKDHNLAQYDLGRMDWEKFNKTMNKIILKFYAAQEAGSRQAWLIGDIRRNGRFYSMLHELCIPGELEQIIVKPQWNVVSEGRSYANKNFVPIAHEFLVVFKKLAPLLVDFTLPQKYEMDIRDSKKATWRDVVFAIMQYLDGDVHHYTEIRKELEGHKKAENNNNVDAKVRQVLRMNENIFEPMGNGYYRLTTHGRKLMAA